LIGAKIFRYDLEKNRILQSLHLIRTFYGFWGN